jgi:hypothetical protein
MPHVIDGEAGERHDTAEEEQGAADRNAAPEVPRRFEPPSPLGIRAQQHRHEARHREAEQPDQDRPMGGVPEHPVIAAMVDVGGHIPVEPEHGDDERDPSDGEREGRPSWLAAQPPASLREPVERGEPPAPVGQDDAGRAHQEQRGCDEGDDDLLAGGAPGRRVRRCRRCGAQQAEDRGRRGHGGAAVPSRAARRPDLARPARALRPVAACRRRCVSHRAPPSSRSDADVDAPRAGSSPTADDVPSFTVKLNGRSADGERRHLPLWRARGPVGRTWGTSPPACALHR